MSIAVRACGHDGVSPRRDRMGPPWSVPGPLPTPRPAGLLAVGIPAWAGESEPHGSICIQGWTSWQSHVPYRAPRRSIRSTGRLVEQGSAASDRHCDEIGSGYRLGFGRVRRATVNQHPREFSPVARRQRLALPDCISRRIVLNGYAQGDRTVRL